MTLKLFSFVSILTLLFDVSFAQINAVDDQLQANNVSVVSYYDMLLNDTYNGVPATVSNVNIELLPNAHGIVFAGGSTPEIRIPAGLTLGEYSIQYKISSKTDASIFDTATILITVCSLPAPSYTVLETNCIERGSITFTGLPASHKITYSKTSSNPITVSGSGTTRTITPTETGYYFFTIKDNTTNCTTPSLYIGLEEPHGVTFASPILGVYNDSNNDNIVNVGDKINYRFAIRNTGACTLNTSIITAVTPNLIISGGTMAPILPGTVNSSVTATYFITQTDINNGSVYQRIRLSTIGNSPYGGMSMNIYQESTVNLNTNGIKLVAFADLNNNGTKDPNEPNYASGHFTYEKNYSGEVIKAASSDGTYFISENVPSSIYVLKFIVDPLYAENAISGHSYTFSTGSGIRTFNFPVTVPQSFNDLSVAMFPVNGAPRPGMIYTNKIVYSNQSHSVASGTVEFTKDFRATITNISEPGVETTPTGFRYNFPMLLPYETKEITVNLSIPTIPAINLGDRLTNSASITLVSGDTHPSNNTASLTQIVEGSYDPNSKSEAHGKEILYWSFTPDDYLIYTIEFENIGTAEAFNVKIVDGLYDFDTTTLQMVKASHRYTLEYPDLPFNPGFKWHFNNINLPPSVPNTDIGKGYIVFKIKPGSIYPNKIVNNAAQIYFDNNPPIITNNVQTKFVTALAVDSYEDNDFTFYPNPVKDIFIVASKSNSPIDLITISDVLGKTVHTEKSGNSESRINLSNLPNGMYQVTVQSKKQQKTIKIIKQ